MAHRYLLTFLCGIPTAPSSACSLSSRFIPVVHSTVISQFLPYMSSSIIPFLLGCYFLLSMGFVSFSLSFSLPVPVSLSVLQRFSSWALSCFSCMGIPSVFDLPAVLALFPDISSIPFTTQGSAIPGISVISRRALLDLIVPLVTAAVFLMLSTAL